ncbi:hypothetical protein LVB87_14800 [Lysobacter sp. KIS68-7]|uniref:hypothetical protein n=1 Tax=Lysobacter sp. KIS68-7 TaxID=2904252 RepID=UPI001E33642B|nr:hypothetical protein [Lysobacter sp. KIS68-7]UHQ19437.1 hypothetical protein LVB87_14800 [Lysobacter sp. KIS68-7]
MRLTTPTLTDDPLPLSFGADSGATGPAIHPEAVARFDALLHELYPDAVRVDADRVRNLCVWLASMPSQAAQDVLDRRLHRIEELRHMLDDASWDPPEAMRSRLAKLIGYLDEDEDMIPDREPLLGKLDDVLLLELAWPAFAAEAEDYRDFCAYRSEHTPAGSGDEQRAAWIRDRLAEIALWQHNMRVNDSHYSYSGHAEAPFRIGS